jgi:RHS repeat-associated protein
VGSLRVVADSSGNVVKRIDYDSFGNIMNDSDPSFAVPFGFAGGLHDRDTGLVRFGFRDYDPDVGRWLAKDPIGFKGGDVDLYGYCLGDPIRFTDRWGLFSADEVVPHALTSAAIKTAEAAGLIGPVIEWVVLEPVAAVVADMILPTEANADEDWDLYKTRELDPGIERMDQLIEEIHAMMDPMERKLCQGNCNPCATR